MDNLRWILLAIGIVLILGIYLWGRIRKKNKISSPLDAANDIPSFSALEEDDDGWKDGVGPVRVVGRDSSDDLTNRFDTEADNPVSAVQAENVEEEYTEPASAPVEAGKQEELVDEPEPAEEEAAPAVDDVVVLYLVSQHGQELKGEQILSATYALHLEYGDMKIFHRLDGNGKIMFSMSNMLEPGWFDVENMHEITTRGISLFVQLSLCEDPLANTNE